MKQNGTLTSKFANRDATVGIIGLGYVGLPLSLAFAEAGFSVRGFDIDDHRVDQLLNSESYIDDVSDDRVANAVGNNFSPAAEPSVVAGCDAYVIAVPTGMADDGPEMSAVEAATETAAKQANSTETLIAVSSTVYPGATREIVAPIIEQVHGGPVQLAMVPERLNPGGNYPFEEIPLVVGADTDSARTAASELFGAIVSDIHPVDSTVTAELTKTLENTYRMVNIALVNELVTLAEGLDGNVWDAIEAAATKPFGYQPFRPGPGVGGHCIPVDPQFLSWRAEDIGTSVSFLDDAHQINEQMPNLVANRLEMLLKARGVALEDASIVALGAAYKPNVGDTRNSPALRVVEQLSKRANITVVDPHTESDQVAHKLVRQTEEANIAEADAVLLLVDHAAFDLAAIGDEAQFIFDTRNAIPKTVTADVVTLGECVDDLPNYAERSVSISQD